MCVSEPFYRYYDVASRRHTCIGLSLLNSEQNLASKKKILWHLSIVPKHKVCLFLKNGGCFHKYFQINSSCSEYFMRLYVDISVIHLETVWYEEFAIPYGWKFGKEVNLVIFHSSIGLPNLLHDVITCKVVQLYWIFCNHRHSCTMLYPSMV